MRGLIARDLSDAAVTAVSADRRFATAYNAALQAANMLAACSGYRVASRTGHHRIAFEAIPLALGAAAERYADYFEICRRKRNRIDYMLAEVASETEAEEALRLAQEFHQLVEEWIARRHPTLRR